MPLETTGLSVLGAQSGAYVPVQLGQSTGSDDTSWVNAILAASAAGSYVRGTPGQTYLIGSPLLLRPGGYMTLDLTGSTVAFKNTSIKTNMLQNGACVPTATATDVTTTAASSTIASPALVAAGAAVGMQVGVVAAGVSVASAIPGRLWLYGTITAVAGNNITLGGNVNGVAADTSLTNATGYLFAARDKNITVIGGIWDAGTNWNVLNDRYNAAYNSDLLRFRRCDGLTLKDVKLAIDSGYSTSGMGWCFGVAPADCTDVLVEHCGSAPGRSAPTVVNTSGLISRMTVRDTFGTSYDDQVAFGTVGAAFDDVEGDITDVLIDGVMANGSHTCIDLYCGQGSNGAQRFLTNAAARSLKGTTVNSPVRITNYNGNAQITADLADITATSAGNSVYNIPTGQPGIVVTGPRTGRDLVTPAVIIGGVPTGQGAAADIPGLSVTFNAPPSGAVWLELYLYSIQQGTVAGNVIAYITDNANGVVAQEFLGNVVASGFTVSAAIKARVAGLTAGAQYTYKARSQAGDATHNGAVLAGAAFPASLRVVGA